MNSGMRWQLRMPRVVGAALGLLLLAVAAAWLWPAGPGGGPRWTPPAPIVPDLSLAGGAPTTAAGPDAAWGASILERPIFAPSRRALPTEPAAAQGQRPPAEDVLSTMRLYGVFSASGGGILAQIEGKPRRVLVNQRVGDWTLQLVSDREVTFARGTETRVVRMPRPKGAGATPGARAAAASDPLAAQAAAGTRTVAEREAAYKAEDEARLQRVDAVLRAAGLPPQRR